ncbi:MAG: HAD hydrolase-like protein, partial [Alphaproteobacteria bacterium]
HCPHHPSFQSADGLTDCQCRKPLPGMVTDLMRAWSIDPSLAFMVGDRETDVAAAEAAGITGIQIHPGEVLPVIRHELQRLKQTGRRI